MFVSIEEDEYIYSDRHWLETWYLTIGTTNNKVYMDLRLV